MKRYWLHLAGQNGPQSELEVRLVFLLSCFPASSSLVCSRATLSKGGCTRQSVGLQSETFRKIVKLYQYLVYFLTLTPSLSLYVSVSHVIYSLRGVLWGREDEERLPVAPSLVPLLSAYCKILQFLPGQVDLWIMLPSSNQSNPHKMVKWLKKILAKKLQIGVTDNAGTGEQQENGKCFYSQYELFVSHIEVKTMSI